MRIRPVSLDALSPACLLPFQQKLGHFSVHQSPGLAPILAEGAELAAYEFTGAAGEMLGFAVVKFRQRILADVSFGPVVMDPSLFVDCIALLKPALRRKGRLILRVYPPQGAPPYSGFPGKFNWATSVVDLDRSEDEVLKSFSPNHRQSIRKAAAAGVRVQRLRQEDVPPYVDGHVSMFARRGIPRSREESLRLVDDLHRLSSVDETSVFLLSAHAGESDGLIGGGIFLRNGDTCTYYQGYADRTEPPLPVLHLVLWEAMRRARAAGCRRFDLSGYSLDEDDVQLKAVNDFKRWFRGEIIRYPDTVVVPLYAILKPVLRLAGKRL